MLSQNQQKLLTALQVKKYRQKYRKFTVEGEKMVAELLAQSHFDVDHIFALPEWANHHAETLKPFANRITTVTESELKRVSAFQTPNQVLAVAHIPETSFSPEQLLSSYCFFLDGIQDPGNLGTIVRIADWFGHSAVFCSPDTVDIFNPKVVQSAMGALFRVPVFEMPLETLLQAVPDQPAIGAVLEGQNLFATSLPPKGILVIGNEGRGISTATESLLQYRISIPKGPGGGAESLNAAVAAGIIAAVSNEIKNRSGYSQERPW